jgi:MFS transporter, FSR family, fosmidomycin resistance protein
VAGRWRARWRAGSWVALAVALGIELLDELVDGTKSAALPLIRAGLHLSYTEIGLLVAVPLLAGSLIELPLGLVAGYGRRRNLLVLAGGLVLAGSLVVVALSGVFGVLLVGLVAFFPASGAFVSLTQAALMDDAGDGPGQQQRMASWNLAGAVGAVAGPLLLVLVLTAGGTWRWAYLLLAGLAVVATVAAAAGGPAKRTLSSSGGQDSAVGGGADAGAGEAADRATGAREALAAIRQGDLARWLILLEVTDLLLDVLTGYVAIYLVDVGHVSPARAAIAVAVRLGAMLAGDVAFVPIARRVSAGTALRASAVAAALLYPAFLLLPWFGAKLAVLAALSIATACWYPVAQAGLYGSVPGRSGVAVFWSSAAGFVGAIGPLAVGLLAQRLGLTWALAALAVAPLAVLALLPGRAGRRSHKVIR